MMRPRTKNQLEGVMHEVKGAIKESAGHLTHNPGLAAEGKFEKAAGKVQQKTRPFGEGSRTLATPARSPVVPNGGRRTRRSVQRRFK